MEHRNYIAYKMPKRIQDKIPEHYIYIKNTEITANRQQIQQEIRKKLDPTNSENLPEYIWPFIYLFNKKIQKVAKTKRMGLWDKFNRRCSKEIKYQGLYNNNQRE